MTWRTRIGQTTPPLTDLEAAVIAEMARRAWGHERTPGPLTEFEQRVANAADELMRRPRTSAWEGAQQASSTPAATHAPVPEDGPQNAMQASNVILFPTKPTKEPSP